MFMYDTHDSLEVIESIVDSSSIDYLSVRSISEKNSITIDASSVISNIAGAVNYYVMTRLGFEDVQLKYFHRKKSGHVYEIERDAYIANLPSANEPHVTFECIPGGRRGFLFMKPSYYLDFSMSKDLAPKHTTHQFDFLTQLDECSNLKYCSKVEYISAEYDIYKCADHVFKLPPTARLFLPSNTKEVDWNSFADHIRIAFGGMRPMNDWLTQSQNIHTDEMVLNDELVVVDMRLIDLTDVYNTMTDKGFRTDTGTHWRKQLPLKTGSSYAELNAYIRHNDKGPLPNVELILNGDSAKKTVGGILYG